MPKSLRTLLLIWLAWCFIMIGYQFYIKARFNLVRPDYSLEWTPSETKANSQANMPYLLEPFLNNHVAWDSEYYISIAVGGYHDPAMRALAPDYSWDDPRVELQKDQPTWTSMNYAFFPMYPWIMRLFTFPIHLTGLNWIASATLAGVLVSMLGTLGAMVALYDLCRDDLGEPGGIRAAYYLLIYPAGMFLAEIYTEGLFLGLSFGAIALARRQKWLWAGLLVALAVWTRAAGGLLLIPLAWYWWKGGNLDKLLHHFSWKEAGKILLVGVPVFSYLLFNALMGADFKFVEDHFFGKGLLLVRESMTAWGAAFQRMISNNLMARAYYLVEFTAILFAFAACVLMWKRDKGLTLYSLATIIFSLTSGGAQGMHRYAMAAPVLFLVTARWGKSEAFDRAWTIANVLLMGVFAILFSFDFWAG